MKIALGFISGMLACGLLLFGVKTVIPIQAQTDNLTESSENLSQSLIDLLPDIERIYRTSLTMPFEKAGTKIYDEDIAEFYQELLDKTVLYEPEDGTN